MRVTANQLREGRRFFTVGAFVLAAAISPPDVLSQLLDVLPMLAAYEAAIWCARMLEEP